MIIQAIPTTIPLITNPPLESRILREATPPLEPEGTANSVLVVPTKTGVPVSVFKNGVIMTSGWVLLDVVGLFNVFDGTVEFKLPEGRGGDGVVLHVIAVLFREF
jgi:hypothetical protein